MLCEFSMLSNWWDAVCWALSATVPLFHWLSLPWATHWNMWIQAKHHPEQLNRCVFSLNRWVFMFSVSAVLMLRKTDLMLLFDTLTTFCSFVLEYNNECRSLPESKTEAMEGKELQLSSLWNITPPDTIRQTRQVTYYVKHIIAHYIRCSILPCT